MPPLIPTNNVSNLYFVIKSPHLVPSPQTSQPLPMYLPSTLNPSDDKLHKDLDNQIQLVKTLQQMLLVERKTLEMMMSQFRTGKERTKCEESIRKRRGRHPGSKKKNNIEGTYAEHS